MINIIQNNKKGKYIDSDSNRQNTYIIWYTGEKLEKIYFRFNKNIQIIK